MVSPQSDEPVPVFGQTKGEVSAEAAAMLGNYPGPALLVRDGTLLASNAGANVLLERAQSWWTELESWLTKNSNNRERGSRTPLLSRIPTDASPIQVEWMVVPLGDDQLLLGRNVTLERSLNEVLTSSRDRFRDLVELSTDLAFEVKEDGTFCYIAGGRALGYTPDELMGRKTSDFLLRTPMITTLNLFETRTPVEHRESWFRRKDGSLARLQISAKPLFDERGDWRGTRGACRDVTVFAAKQEELAQMQRRDQLVARFMKSLREAQEAKVALSIAAREINEALQGAGCRIYNLDPSGDLHMAVEAGAGLPELVTSYSRKLKDSGEEVMEQVLSSAALIGATTRQGSALNGSIWVWRPADKGGWPEIDQNLLREVADHLGVVIAQFDYQEKLRILSECDGLTRLLNRRTFTEKLGQRLGASTQGSALFYIDLDNFKPVNDTHGHQRGDMVIKKLADILRLVARPDDLAGRMGGDEFVLWLDGIDHAGAEAMAKRLVSSGAELRNLSAGPDKPLGVSVGVAVVPPNQNIRLNQLMEQADAAMYQAKRSGKSTWAIK